MKGICRNPLLCIDSMSAEYGTERIYESFAEQKRDQTFMGDWNGRYQNQLEGKRISVWTSYESKSTGIWERNGDPGRSTGDGCRNGGI